MRQALRRIALGALFSVACAAHAEVDWSWSFTSPVVNLAASQSVFITLSNHAASTEPLMGFIKDLSDLGPSHGVLTDPNGSHLVPTFSGPADPLAFPIQPGQTITFEAIYYHFDGTPTPGVQYVVPYRIGALTGKDCQGQVFDNLCQLNWLDAPPSLTLTYLPVPETSSWSLLLAGLAGVGWRARRMLSGHR